MADDKPASDGKEPHSMEEVLETIEDIAEEQPEVCIRDALDHFGHASYTPLLIILPLVEISPVGGIPGIPTALAITLALVAAQMLFGKEHLWLPDFIQNRTADGEKLAKAAHKLDNLAQRIDQLVGDRLDFLTKGLWVKVAAFFIILLCATVPPLEVVPFASSLPMIAVAVFGLAILVRDGLLMLAGFAMSAGSVYLVASTLLGGGSGG